MMHLLFGIADADGHVNKDERDLLKVIAAQIGVAGARLYQSAKHVRERR